MVDLKKFIEPNSIAMIGASAKSGSMSSVVIKNLISLGYKGEIYLVNPNGEKLFGLNVYRSLMEIDGDVDLGILFVNPARVTGAISECAERGIESVIIVSDGLDQKTSAGNTIETEIVNLAKNKGVRIVGPNSMGIVNSANNFCTSFIPVERLPRGGLSLVSQSGIFIGAVLSWIISEKNIGISKSIDLANKCDVDEVEVLEYFLNDKDTRVVVVHLESVRDGQKFLQMAKEVSLDKPILAFKTGKTAVGAKLVYSHTGSISGKDDAYNAAFLQSGIIRVTDIEEMLDLATAFMHLPPLKGNKIAVITYTGGWGALTADFCEEFGLEIAELSKSTLQRVKDVSPPWRDITNPVDIWPPAKMDAQKSYRAAIRAVMEDDGVDAVIVLAPASTDPVFDIFGVLEEEVKRYEKPMVIWAVGNKKGMDKAAGIIASDVVVYSTIKRAVKVLSKLYQYYRNKRISFQSQ